jgi:hypothetical protein
MVLFFIAYLIAEFIITVLAVFQFLTVLITRNANEPLLKLGNNLSRYVYQIFRFLTFNSEEHPFPFGAWPDDEPGDNHWVSNASPDSHAHATYDATPAPTPEADTTGADSVDPAAADAGRKDSQTPEPGKD